MRHALLAFMWMLSACSTIGSAPSQPEGLPHGGQGPFRLLTADEVDVPPTPPGSTIFNREHGIENGMVASRHLFYGGAKALPMEASDGGMSSGIDAGVAPSLEIDWTLFEARRIYRSRPRAEGFGFDGGDEVLIARHPWEGGFVHDPWALELDDGSVLLYYAAEGGIGVARAENISGTFERIGTEPLIRGVVRRPSVIDARDTPNPHAFLMYFERGGAIFVAGSEDGNHFEELGEIMLPQLPARDERDSTETAIGAPGVIAVRTSAGRSIVRLYYESRRASGQVLIALAASFDGMTFEQFNLPIISNDQLRWPAPRQLDTRTTLLYLGASRSVRGVERGALVAGIAPGGVRLP